MYDIHLVPHLALAHPPPNFLLHFSNLITTINKTLHINTNNPIKSLTMNNISEKQAHEPLLPTTTTTATDLEKHPPPSTTTSSLAPRIPHALRKRIKAFRTFIRSTTSLENFYDFLAAGLRTGTLVVQGVCLAGVGVWVLGVCGEAVGLGYVLPYFLFS